APKVALNGGGETSPTKRERVSEQVPAASQGDGAATQDKPRARRGLRTPFRRRRPTDETAAADGAGDLPVEAPAAAPRPARAPRRSSPKQGARRGRQASAPVDATEEEALDLARQYGDLKLADQDAEQALSYLERAPDLKRRLGKYLASEAVAPKLHKVL